MRSVVFTLLFCALLSLAAARFRPPHSDNIVLDLDGNSHYKYIAVEVENAAVGIQSVEIKETKAKSWSSMTFDADKNLWTFSYQTRINFPVSFQIISETGEIIMATDAFKALNGYSKFDTGSQFTAAAEETNTESPETEDEDEGDEDVEFQPAAKAYKQRPTTTRAPKKTKPTTTKAPKKSRPTTTKAPTKTSTSAPSKAAPTSAPTKGSSNNSPTNKPNSNSASGCSAPMKLMVPLYTYPGSTWDTVMASARTVQTVAIINPNSGPGNGPDSTYKAYATKMYNAGVEMVGYVHTSYGARSISVVKQEIDTYASDFSYISGIFLDEASASTAQLAYYQELHNYIMSLPGFKYNIINPGATPAAGYVNAATQIVSFESGASSFAASSTPSFASCSNKDMFAAISYGASSASAMQSFVNTAKSKGYYGWVYVNDGQLTGGTYNRIPSYYAQQAAAVASA